MTEASGVGEEHGQAEEGGSALPFDPAVTSGGARFYRADLHVHTFGASKDVRDAAMTPEAVVAEAVARGIHIIAITDHNTAQNVAPAIAAAAGLAGTLLVIPGIEITTPDGHVLALLPPDRAAELGNLIAKLDLETTTDGTVTRLRIEKVAELTVQAGGLAIPAHIDRENTGFATKATFHDQAALLASPHIAALEIDDAANLFWYSDQDKGSDRGKHWTQRLTRLGPVAGPRLPKVQFSDAHELASLGTNRRTGAEKVTRIKMDVLSFEGLRAALLDPEARIRTEVSLPGGYPRLIAVKFTGGFLNGQVITFSSSLTCLIGGRGAGKSTALEAIRWACDPDADPSLSDQPHWPQRVDVCYEDEFGTRRWVTREAGFPYPVELGGEGPVRIDLEGYEQDHTASVIRGYKDDPGRLLEFLDQFAELEEVQTALGDLQQKLSDNAKVLLPIERVPDQLKKANDSLKEVKRQIGIVDKTNYREALRWRRLLLQERSLRDLITQHLVELMRGPERMEVALDLATLAKQAGLESLEKTISADLLTAAGDTSVDSRLKALAEALRAWKEQGKQLIDQARAELTAVMETWKSREIGIEAKIEASTQALLSQGVNPDLKAINALAAAEAAAAKEVQRLEVEESKRKVANEERQLLLGQYRQLQSRRFQLRTAQGQELTKALGEAIGGFAVSIAYRPGGVTGSYESWLRPALDRHFIRGDRLGAFCEANAPADLAHLARSNLWNRARQILDGSGQPYLTSDDEAKAFLECLRKSDLYELEGIASDDRPVISLTLEQDGKFRTVPFEDLSFGQKSSILLGILLFSKATAPLVIDQPEDHLDSQFIYEAVVGTLRRIKEQRQVIIATHNANIAVLGDAELILPLRAWQDRGVIADRGSVDTTATRDRACRILEGGETAYRRRGELYGFRFDST